MGSFILFSKADFPVKQRYLKPVASSCPESLRIVIFRLSSLRDRDKLKNQRDFRGVNAVINKVEVFNTSDYFCPVTNTEF